MYVYYIYIYVCVNSQYIMPIYTKYASRSNVGQQAATKNTRYRI